MLKGQLSGLRQFLAIESFFKMMKDAFYFLLKALSILEIFTFSFWLFGYVEKRLDNKVMVNFNIYDVTHWTKNHYNTHITQYLKK